MGTSIIKVGFPCGYHMTLYGKGIGMTMDGTLEDMPTCPIHGEKCGKVKQ